MENTAVYNGLRGINALLMWVGGNGLARFTFFCPLKQARSKTWKQLKEIFLPQSSLFYIHSSARCIYTVSHL